MKKYSLEIKWGLIFVAMMLIWMVGERLAGLHDENIHLHAIYTNFIMIPAIAVYVFALLEKRRVAYNGVMTYKQGFISGLIITAVVTVISPLTQIITSLVITPEYFENVIAYTVSEGMMTEEAARAEFNLQNYIIMSAVSAPILGLVTSALVAIFTRKK
jgi:hypothetical protein